jgi:hypothetical protein
VSDRQDEVLNAIDATLSGFTDDDPISEDAMRWSPEEPAADTPMLHPALQDYFAERLHPWQMRMLSDVISAGPGRLEIETRGRNVMGPRGLRNAIGGPVRGPGSSDAIPVRLSPGEAMVLGPNGPIHIRGAYGDQPMQVTEVDLDDTEGDDQ